MISAQIVETSVTNNSSFQNYRYPHPDVHTMRTSVLLCSASKSKELKANHDGSGNENVTKQKDDEQNNSRARA